MLLSGCASRPPLARGTRADSVLVEKSAHRLTLFAGDSVLRRYDVALSRHAVGDKVQEGDLRVPEGRYTIDRRVEASAFHRALNISYPDSAHVARAAALGVVPGGQVMIHGIRNGFGWLGRLHRLVDWTAGCVALTDPEIEELWRTVPDGTTIQIRP